MAVSQITTAIQNTIAQDYISILGRNPDAAGFGYWTTALANAGAGTAANTAIVNGFSIAPEFVAMYGGQTTAGAVNLMYNNILGRNADANGSIYWQGVANALIAGGATISQAYAQTASQMITAAAANTGTADATLITTKTAAAVAQGTIPGVTTTLTTNGTGATFTSGVVVPSGALVLNDLAGSATDVVTAAGGASIAATNLTINGGQIGATADAITANLNTSAWSTVKNVTINGGGGTAAAIIVSTAAPTLAINGGSTLNISDSSTGANAITSLALNGNSGAVTLATNLNALTSLSLTSEAQSVTVVATAGTRAQTLTLNGVTGGTVTDATATTLNIVSSGTATTGLTVATDAATTANITSNIATTLVVLQDAAAKTVTINGSANTTITTLTDAAATTINVAGTGGVATIGTYTTTGAITAINISGGEGFKSDVSGLTKLAGLTATGAGVITVTIDDTAQTFTGGAGQDVVTVVAAATKAIAAGTATNNEIIYNATGPGAGKGLAGTGGSVTGFTVLGVAGNSTGTFDLSQMSTINALDDTGAVGGNIVFSKVAAGTTLAIDATDAGNNNVTYTAADSTGATDSLSLTLGVAGTTAAGFAVAGNGTLTVADAAGVGFGTLNVTANNKTAGQVETINVLSDTALSAINISGTGGLQVTTFANDTAASLTINNTSTSTAASGFGTLTDNKLTSLTFTGTGLTGITTLNDTSASLTINQNNTNAATAGVTIGTLTDAALSTLTLTGSNALTISANSTSSSLVTINANNAVADVFTAMTDNSMTTFNLTGTGALTFTSLTDTVAAGITLLDSDSGAVSIATLVDAAATSLSVANSGTGSLTIGSTANIETALTSLTLLGNVTFSNSGAAVLASVNGASDNLVVTLGLTHTTAAAATVILGNGNNVITDAATTAVDTFTLGSGNNSITLSGIRTAGTDVVTAGNGNNTITATASTTANLTATLGNGNNTILTAGETTGVDTLTIGTGTDAITLGVAHTVVSSITFTGANGGSAAAASMTTITNAGGGAATADTLTFAYAGINNTVTNAGAFASLAAGLAQVNNTSGIVEFNDGTNTYIYENTGTAAHNQLVTLVGAAHTVSFVGSTGIATVTN